MKSKIYFFLKILILISPFIALFLAVIERKRYEHWTPPVFELTALGLFIFSISYLLIELIIMKSKKLKKKVKNNFILIMLYTMTFTLIIYLFDLWK